MPSDLKDKNSEPIHVGDHVFTHSHGGNRGRHEGEVEKIVISKEEAEREGVQHPPKVDQHGHHVEHNPEVLQHREYRK
ncbi:hypothetical protein N0V85_006886 [Neurospora sp. IMI 360204]|nr:hypothetical protein N0V85_006886 [Neurospora sp. IMI 360204]